MIGTRWGISDLDEDQQTSPGRPAPSLVSLHFVRSALLRRWLVCVLSAVLGLLMAMAFLVAFPTSHQAKAALVLAHDPQVEPSRAMATDVSLLRTRTVAAKTIANLGLAISPEDFLKSVTAEPGTSELLSLTLTAPSDAEAVRRLAALTTIYLEFRGEQLSLQSNVLASGIQQRITKLQSEVAALSRRIEQLSRGGSSSASKLSDTISQRAYVQSRIETLQQSLEDATLQATAVVASSRVIDPAAVEKGSVRRRVALTLASGLIGGAALGCGMVLFFAITSDRLRRRSDIAAALEVPVPVSVGRIEPLPKRWLRSSPLRKLDGRRAHERQRLAHAIEMELPLPRQSGRLAVVCLDNAAEVRFAVAAAATDLLAAKHSVDLIDLTEHGSLEAELAPSMAGSTHRPTVLRPRGIPALAGGAADLRAVDHEDWNPDSLELTDVTLILADLDPSVGVDHLTAWTDRVIIAVTAGRSSAELVRTAADLVRTAGLEFRFAVLLRTERTDDSSGTAGFDRPATIHLLAGYDRAEWAAESIDEERTTAEETLAEAPVLAVDEEAAQEQPAAEDQIEEQSVDDEQVADQQEATAEEEYAEEQQPADLEQGTTEGTGRRRTSCRRLRGDHRGGTTPGAARRRRTGSRYKKPAAEEQDAEEQPADLEQGTTEEQAEDQEEPAADLDQVADQESPSRRNNSRSSRPTKNRRPAARSGGRRENAASPTAPSRRQPRRGRQRKVDSTSTIVNADAVPIDESIAEEQTHTEEQPPISDERTGEEERRHPGAGCRGPNTGAASRSRRSRRRGTDAEEQPADLEKPPPKNRQMRTKSPRAAHR